MTTEEILQILAEAQSIWPQRIMSPETIEAYAERLRDLEPDALRAALEQLSVTSTFLPSIAELRTTAVNALPGNAIPDPDTAWAEVKAQVAAVGSTRGMPFWRGGVETIREPSWSHQAIEDAAEAMGWDYLCNQENEEAARAHFLRFYGSTSGRMQRDQTLTPAGRELLASLGTIGRSLELGPAL